MALAMARELLAAYGITIDHCKVPSLATLCDNRPKLLLSQHTLSATHSISRDEGVSTHAQDRCVEYQQQYTGWRDSPPPAGVFRQP
jgi:hypothetical protein